MLNGIKLKNNKRLLIGIRANRVIKGHYKTSHWIYYTDGYNEVCKIITNDIRKLNKIKKIIQLI